MNYFDVPELSAGFSAELEESVLHLAISRDGTQLACCSVEDEICLLQGDGSSQSSLGGHRGGTNRIAFAGELLMSVGEDGHLRIWGPAVGKLLHELEIEGEKASR